MLQWIKQVSRGSTVYFINTNKSEEVVVKKISVSQLDGHKIYIIYLPMDQNSERRNARFLQYCPKKWSISFYPTTDYNNQDYYEVHSPFFFPQSSEHKRESLVLCLYLLAVVNIFDPLPDECKRYYEAEKSIYSHNIDQLSLRIKAGDATKEFLKFWVETTNKTDPVAFWKLGNWCENEGKSSQEKSLMENSYSELIISYYQNIPSSSSYYREANQKIYAIATNILLQDQQIHEMACRYQERIRNGELLSDVEKERYQLLTQQQLTLEQINQWRKLAFISLLNVNNRKNTLSPDQLLHQILGYTDMSPIITQVGVKPYGETIFELATKYNEIKTEKDLLNEKNQCLQKEIDDFEKSLEPLQKKLLQGNSIFNRRGNNNSKGIPIHCTATSKDYPNTL